jgi:hypothetical protein
LLLVSVFVAAAKTAPDKKKLRKSHEQAAETRPAFFVGRRQVIEARRSMNRA